jgi:penicillin-binding protein 2
MSRKHPHFDPDLIFVDSVNVSDVDQERSERRLEAPLSRISIIVMGMVFLLIGATFLYKAYDLQIVNGEENVRMSTNNRLNYELIFANRGTITDRKGELLAWNVPPVEEGEFAGRSYIKEGGFSHLLGYIKYPKKDKNGFYYNTEYEGFGGIEQFYDDRLQGDHGLRIVETDALGEITSRNGVESASDGESLKLSIDARVQKALYDQIMLSVEENGFDGGAGAIMELETGRLIGMTSYPEFSSQMMTEGKDVDGIAAAFSDERNIFLSRATSGLYTPGSVVKTIMSLAALQEKIIDPTMHFVSRGSLVIPNPYNPDLPSIFNDWKAHGSVDVSDALAVSSNVFYYIVGGGFDDIKGLGIERINKYMAAFGLGKPMHDSLFGEASGTVPSIAWKEKNFPGEPWRLGDTYYTSIGQYGFQVTTMQLLRAVAAIATNGTLVEPTVLEDGKGYMSEVDIVDDPWYEEVQAGMRQAVTDGTARALGYPDVHFAAKTGTAELGISKAQVNTWVMGFYPYEKPKYAFIVMMESGPRSNTVGASTVARRAFDQIRLNAPEYLGYDAAGEDVYLEPVPDVILGAEEGAD